MPASQKTPNYQLPIYAEEDVTSYLQDFNPAMQKIDTQMKANADAAAAAQSDADSLDTRVRALEEAPAGVTELDSNTDVTGFENGYILVNNNGKLGAIEPSGGTGTDPNAIHASGGGTFSASEEIGSTGPYNIVVDEEPAGVPITSDDVTVPESASAFAGQTVTEALESLQGGVSSGAAAENVSYDNAASGLAATNVQDAIDEVAGLISIDDVKWNGMGIISSIYGMILNGKSVIEGICANLMGVSTTLGGFQFGLVKNGDSINNMPDVITVKSARLTYNKSEYFLTPSYVGGQVTLRPQDTISIQAGELFGVYISYTLK